MSGAEIEDHFRSAFSNRTSVLSSLWKLGPGPLTSFMKPNGTAFGQIDIEKVLDIFLPKRIAATFEELSIPLKITGTDFYGNRLKVMEKGDLRKAMAASSAIPVVFKPVVVDGCILIDGGINNPLPFDLLDSKTQLIIAVDVVGLPQGNSDKIPGRVDSGFGASQLMMQSITNLKLAANPPDLFLRPPVNAFRVLDFLKVNEILKITSPVYDDTRRGLERLLTSLEVR
jgi:NTE family protein